MRISTTANAASASGAMASSAIVQAGQCSDSALRQRDQQGQHGEAEQRRCRVVDAGRPPARVSGT